MCPAVYFAGTRLREAARVRLRHKQCPAVAAAVMHSGTNRAGFPNASEVVVPLFRDVARLLA